MTALLIMLVALTSIFTITPFASTISSSKPGQHANAPIVLPVEIMGPAGTTESVTFDLNEPESVMGLWMQVHNLSYNSKASIKINEGAWIDLTNTSVTVAEPEVHIGGIGGGYSTIRLTLPLSASDVQAGSNTIQFRFNETDGLSSGWRVLKFNFVRLDGSFILPESAFTEDDPAGWTPVLASQADIDQGEYLWLNAPLVEASGTPMQARCADCHAQDGRDLKYFNYSNKSIVARGEFHGLSTLESEQIASYIRSLDLPAPGRPWNPPYQPGPGLDDKPVEEWSAGAGLEWVLDKDAETLDYLFPNGITDGVASTRSTLNMRELPLALQFPDWNRWLPPVHPKDFWGDAFLTSDAWDSYINGIPDALARGIEDAIEKRLIMNAIQKLDSDVSDFRENEPLPAGKTGEDHALANLGLQTWQIVKVWEVMQTYELEGRAPDMYPDGESRSWFSIARNVFNVAPHISGAGGSTVHTHGSEMLDKFFSHTWYMYQVVINSGNRNPQGHRPVDWKYQIGHHSDYSKHTGLPSGARLIATYIKMLQMLDNENGIGSDGWYIRHAHPYWFARSVTTEHGKSADLFDSVPVEDHARISEVLLRAFMEKTLEFEVSEWPRGEEHEQLEPVAYVPQPYDGKGSIFDDRFNYADNFYRLVPVFYDLGVSPALLDTVATWGAEAWPLGDWDSLIDYDPGDGGGDPGDGGDDPPVLYGDTTGDGTVSALDAALVFRHLSGNVTLDGNGLIAGNVDGDGELTAGDALLILQRVLGQIGCFPAEVGCAV